MQNSIPRQYLPEEHDRWLSVLPKRASSAALILETNTRQALIVKANYKDYWTLPGGIIDPSETPKQAALRETAEEIGLLVPPKEAVFVWVANRESDIADTYQFVFRAPITEDALKKIVLQPSEIDEYALVTKEQVLRQDRHYAQAIRHWANGLSGYVEQTFGKGA